MGRIKRGRPSKDSKVQKQTQLIQKSEPEYIADDQYAQRIFKLISTSALYKNIVLTGPAGPGRASGEKLTKVTQNTADKIKESNRNLKQTLLKFGLEENYVFFFNSQPKKLIIKDNKIVDETKYENLIRVEEYDYKFKRLINILNLIFKELVEQFVTILTNIFDIYSNSLHDNLDETIENTITIIRDDKEKYQYLLQWEELKMISNESRYRKNIEGLDKIKEKIQQKTKESGKKKTDKIQNKYKELIEKQLIDYNLEHDTKPIDLFVSEFIKIIHEFQQNQQYPVNFDDLDGDDFS